MLRLLMFIAALCPMLARALPEDAQAGKRRFTFAALQAQPAMRVFPADGPPAFGFGLRADEKPVAAVVRLRVMFSPLLIPGQSHMRVLVNDEVAGVVPVTRQNTGRSASHEIALDPALLKRDNKLSVDFIGHYTTECEDPVHSGLWAELGRGTEIELTVRKREQGNDLASLPEPFFDQREMSRLMLPYVFGAAPSHATLRAAGITSSWFGKLAGWRNARFPAHLGTLPAGHAVVFATNAERPGFLADHAPFTGPALSMLTSPADGSSRLLLVSGRDGEDLAVAANALVLGTQALSGAYAAIDRSGIMQPRRPYDAPNWVRTDRPMKLGELVESPQRLQVYGHVPEPVKVSLRIPPDLFTWRSRGVPVDLKFRYTPPVRTSDSTLSMSINGELVQSLKLRSSGQGGESARLTLPLLDDGLLGEGREILIPAFKLGSRNQLQYSFMFSYHAAGNCRDNQVENIRAMIDADSRIDFSGYPHYAEMPHLGYFSTAGYPFTKYADLSQTVVVMPDRISATDIEVMLSLLARMGESTGYPATRVQVAGAGDQNLLADRDLLLIGAHGRQRLLEQWRAQVPAILAGPRQRISKAEDEWDLLSLLGRHGSRTDAATASQKHVRGNGPLAALLGFESPLTPRRSVVAVTGIEPADLIRVLDTLEGEDAIKTLHGSVVLMHGGVVESLYAGKKYHVGSLPVWTAIWFPLSTHPVLLAVMSVFAVLIFAFALWRTLRVVAAKRLGEHE